MKTKKAILQWWKDLGDREFGNDFLELQTKLDRSISFDRFFDLTYIKVKLNKAAWKFPLELYFAKGENGNIECWRIGGF